MSDLGGVGETLFFNQSSVTNKNATSSTHCGPVETQGAHLFLMLFYSLVFLVGLLLNGFTLKVYFCRAQQQTSSNFGASAFYLNMYASILFMGYIAANRYLKIVHPLGTHILQTVRATHVISTVTWVLLLAMMMTYVLLSLLTQESLQSVPMTASCDVLHSQLLRVLYKVFHTCSAIIFLLVLISLVFFYYSTSHRLSLAQQRQLASSSSKKLAKSRRNMLVLVSVFCICFVPYHLVRLPYTFLKRQCSWSQAFFYLKELTVMVSVLNVCLDPLIYFLFYKAFRAQMSLRRMFSTTQVTTHAERFEGRSSAEQRSTIRTNRKTSLIMTTKQNCVL